MADWVVGQRCASVGEPALGLGMIKELEGRNITVVFPATSTQRVYAQDKAPLRRVQFEPGETVYDNDHNSFIVEEVKEQNGLLFYLGGESVLPEISLNHAIVFSKPHQKLLAGQVDKPREFDLRRIAWDVRHESLSHPARGFGGARIELIPHQLYIASEVARRHHPRVLLSDEVGLGKTIEAGLIFHRLWRTGEVRRVLCLVPGQLTTQWLTELYRKFNVLFSIMTPNQAEELAKTHPGLNPYHAHQCVLQALNTAVSDPELREWVVEGDWDLLIVDEAHHLFWSEQNYSPEYELVEDLSKVCGGMLLLTATPRQLGLASHFGRLRLLDPERFDSLDKFNEEIEKYGAMAELTDKVLAGEVEETQTQTATLFPDDEALIEMAPTAEDDSPEQRQAFCRALVDRHGTGRMVFRNHRKVMTGFPKRNVHACKLPCGDVYAKYIKACIEMVRVRTGLGQRMLAGPPAVHAGELEGKTQTNRTMLQRAWREDPRLTWLLPLLREHAGDKFLLICSKREVVLALQEWLAHAPDIDVAVFHEEMTLLERDRQAAYFSKTNGARILICSEIGSEGRNFQFAHKLVLFDLPLNPALLEQRIGRLDRIGQHNDIDIYIPYPEDTPLQYLHDWYSLGLDAFENHLLEGDYIYEEVREDIFTIYDAVGNPDLMDNFLEESRIFTDKLKQTIEKGRDRLLELNSFDPATATKVIGSIEELESGEELKAFMDDVFDLFNIIIEDQEEIKTQILHPSPQMSVEHFPGLPEEGLEVTYDREKAVAREDLTFLSNEHPMVEGAIDLLLGIEKGITSFSLWKQAPEPGVLLECVFIFECQASEEVFLTRYLPPVPIHIAVDQTMNARPDLLELLADVSLEHGPVSKIHKQRNALTQIVENLVQVAEQHAEEEAEALLAKAEKRAMNEIKVEYDRLRALTDINPSVRPEELEHLEDRLNMIIDHLEDSKVRLDAVRLIMLVPA